MVNKPDKPIRDGRDGRDSVVPGPAGADSVVPGSRGRDSVVPGPAGRDSIVPGPAGPAGRAGKGAPKRAMVGYLILVLTIPVGMYGFQKHLDSRLRQQLNDLGRSGCLTSRVSLGKYNDFVQSAIDNRNDLIREARRRHDKAAEAIHEKAIVRFDGNFIRVPTKIECQQPIVP